MQEYLYKQTNKMGYVMNVMVPITMSRELDVSTPKPKSQGKGVFYGE